MRKLSELVRCSKCSGVKFDNLICHYCGYEVNILDDILDLRIDKSFDTLLDLDSYDQGHGINSNYNSSLCDVYCSILEIEGLTPGGSVLEIACGSGNLTASMLVGRRFETVHCGDISHGFMKLMGSRIANIETPTRTNKYLFDANNLPFRDQSFDFVFGNSVLHHFATFEKTVEDAYRVLKPNGAAVFAEPIIDAHSFVSLASGIIVRCPNVKDSVGMTSKHIAVLNILKDRSGIKMRNLNSDRSHLRSIEDKFQFPVEFLKDLGKQIGFSKVVLSKNKLDFKLGEVAKMGILKVFSQVGVSAEPLDAFQYVFDALTEDYGAPMHDYIPPVFAQIAFFR